jgi:MarR family 2-MHQ and catechol resistance regulon transcriptional repressor
MGTRHQGTAAEIAALNAYIKLQRAAEAVAGRVHALLPPELTSSQFGVLEALHHIGPLCQGELAEKLLKSNANLTLVVDNLEKSGLVARARDPADRRFVVVKLTDRGQRLIARLFPRIARQVADELKLLSPAELDELGRLCKRVGLRA